MENKYLLGLKRVWFDLIILVAILFVFFDGLYESLSNPIQLILLKVVLVSIGILHAHYMGKFLFPKIHWDEPLNNQIGSFYARIGLYIIIPCCYAFGG